MQANKVVVSIGTYEGSLVGLTAESSKAIVESRKDETETDPIKQEFAFAASQGSLSCMASEGNIMAVAGSEEVIKVFDLKQKVSYGEFSGEVHQSTITALAISKTCSHLLSGDEKGVIGIWRVKDQEPLHRLVVKNTSRVVSLSMHESGRMLMALYANGVLRLWNMLDARCLFKKKVGLSAQSSESDDADIDDGESVEEEKEDKAQSRTLQSVATRQVLKQMDKINLRPE
mmetsp:Transcript_24389/g.30288  ORF Transcript_24389/g.30288 Transcript_24389/m.30288 type:complete len:230 (-) Transcript_24389:733-1422(-)